MRQIMGHIINMLPYMLISLPIIVIARMGVYLSRRNKEVKVNLLREAGIIVFALYLVGVASQTIIPKLSFSVDGIGIVGGGGICYSRINLVPLNKFTEIWQTVYLEGYTAYLLLEVLGNIGVFTVIGFMLPLLWRRFKNLKNTVIACFLISLFIEIIQLVLPRATDIDDLLMNILGGIIGYYIYFTFNKISKGIIYQFKYD